MPEDDREEPSEGVVFRDPSAGGTRLTRWRLGNVLFVIAGLLLLLGLPAAAIATWLGEISGVVWPVVSVGVGSLVLGSGLHHGVTPPELHPSDLAVQPEDDDQDAADDATEASDSSAGPGARDDDGLLLTAHQAAVAMLSSSLSRVLAATTVPEMAEVRTTAERIAFAAALELSAAAETLGFGGLGDNRHAFARVEAAHARAIETAARLDELRTALGPPRSDGDTDDRPESPAVRHARAMEELGEVTEWVRLRQESLDSLRRSDHDPEAMPEGRAQPGSA